MLVYVTKEAARLARKAKVSEDALNKAVADAENGLIDANLGSGIIKQRIPGTSSGKSKGSRAVALFIKGKRAIFLHVFPKNAKANLTPLEEEAYRDLGKILAAMDDEKLEALANQKGWRRIDNEQHREEVPERPAPLASSGGRGPGIRRSDRQGDEASVRRGVPDDG